jgi:hypothetical protein
VRHTIDGSVDFVQFYVNYNDTERRYEAILSRNLRWRLEHESIHVYVSTLSAVPVTAIWPCMALCMITEPLAYPLRSSPTVTSSSFRFACIASRYFIAMQAFMTANFMYAPDAPTSPPSFEHKVNTKGLSSDNSNSENKDSSSSTILVPSATAPVEVSPTIGHYECWSYYLANVSHFKPVLLSSLSWPQRATAAATSSGIITITSASLRSLTYDDIPLVNSQWVYRNGTSMEHLQHAVQHYPSVGCVVDGTVNHGNILTSYMSLFVFVCACVRACRWCYHRV